MAEEPATGVRVAHLVFAAVGIALLAVACFVTVVIGALSSLTTDSCTPDDFGPAGPANCRNADTVVTILLLTPIVVFVDAAVGTWLPSRKYAGYVPHGRVPFAGIVVLACTWFAAESLVPSTFF